VDSSNRPDGASLGLNSLWFGMRPAASPPPFRGERFTARGSEPNTPRGTRYPRQIDMNESVGPRTSDAPKFVVGKPAFSRTPLDDRPVNALALALGAHLFISSVKRCAVDYRRRDAGTRVVPRTPVPLASSPPAIRYAGQSENRTLREVVASSPAEESSICIRAAFGFSLQQIASWSGKSVHEVHAIVKQFPKSVR